MPTSKIHLILLWLIRHETPLLSNELRSKQSLKMLCDEGGRLQSMAQHVMDQIRSIDADIDIKGSPKRAPLSGRCKASTPRCWNLSAATLLLPSCRHARIPIQALKKMADGMSS